MIDEVILIFMKSKVSSMSLRHPRYERRSLT